jgi:hypothetical protein
MFKSLYEQVDTPENVTYVESLQSHVILTMSHWSSGLPVCFPSQGTQVQIPWGILKWNRDSPVSVVSLYVLCTFTCSYSCSPVCSCRCSCTCICTWTWKVHIHVQYCVQVHIHVHVQVCKDYSDMWCSRRVLRNTVSVLLKSGLNLWTQGFWLFKMYTPLCTHFSFKKNLMDMHGNNNTSVGLLKILPSASGKKFMWKSHRVQYTTTPVPCINGRQTLLL